jgi:cell division protein ZapE
LKSQNSATDPIPPIARDLAADAWILCFDEFQVRLQLKILVIIN